MSPNDQSSGSPLGAWVNELFSSDLQRRIRDLVATGGGDGERPRRKRYRAHYWEVYSPRLNRRVGIYRNIGHDHWVLIETDLTVSWYTTFANSHWRPVNPYTRLRPFDMVLQRGDAVECHRLIGRDGEERGCPEAAIERAWCEARGLLYREVHSSDIELHRLYIENWKRMLPYIRKHPHPLIVRVLGYVSAVAELTLGELDILLADVEQSEARACVYQLLHQGRLVAPDLALNPLSSATIVRIRHAK